MMMKHVLNYVTIVSKCEVLKTICLRLNFLVRLVYFCGKLDEYYDFLAYIPPNFEDILWLSVAAKLHKNYQPNWKELIFFYVTKATQQQQ